MSEDKIKERSEMDDKSQKEIDNFFQNIENRKDENNYFHGVEDDKNDKKFESRKDLENETIHETEKNLKKGNISESRNGLKNSKVLESRKNLKNLKASESKENLKKVNVFENRANLKKEYKENLNNKFEYKVSSKNTEKFKKIGTEKDDKREKKSKKPLLICICIAFILLIFSTIFSLMNMRNTDKIISGISIEGIDVSGLTSSDAKAKLELIYNDKKTKNMILKYNDYSTEINTELLDTDFGLDDAVQKAVSEGKDKNIFANNYDILFTLLKKKNIDIDVKINEDEAKKQIENIDSKIPGALVEPDYYVEDDKLVITKGKEGIKVNEDELLTRIKTNLTDISSNSDYIEIPTFTEKPQEIDIDKIHDEVYKEVKDAYYTKNPFKVYPEVEGVDFDVNAAKELLKEDKEEYEIKLTITKPKVATSDLGSEAFPDKLGTCTTRYDASLTDRSTNLKIACNKINGKVILPGETFSYNKTLGERTIAAGYKNGKVYENGRVVDGIGGGICQISSTLYNAVLKANLGIVERKNHQFVTSYLPAGQDATVVYGLTDFKFKNTRNYAVKISASASNGIATVSIYGIKEDEEYNITLSTKTISTIPFTVRYEDDSTLSAGKETVVQKGANGIITETYITKTLNGKVVSSTLLSKDTYNAMQKIIKRGTQGAVSSGNGTQNSDGVGAGTANTIGTNNETENIENAGNNSGNDTGDGEKTGNVANASNSDNSW